MRVENIIFLKNDIKKIIDFELICEGDPLWDVAKLIDSVLSQKAFRQFNVAIFEKKITYILSFLKEYWNVKDLSSKKQEIQYIVNYWALAKTFNLFYSPYDFLVKDITVVKRFIDDGDILCQDIINEKLSDTSFFFAKGCKYL